MTPSSTNSITVMAVIVFEMLATRKRSRGSAGSPEAGSRRPKAWRCTTSPPIDTATDAAVFPGRIRATRVRRRSRPNRSVTVRTPTSGWSSGPDPPPPTPASSTGNLATSTSRTMSGPSSNDGSSSRPEVDDVDPSSRQCCRWCRPTDRRRRQPGLVSSTGESDRGGGGGVVGGGRADRRRRPRSWRPPDRRFRRRVRAGAGGAETRHGHRSPRSEHDARS